MKLGIMQPYFFPYVGYFSLINYTDKWIVFDTVQYIYHGWINRNRVLKPGREDWQYVVVPLRKHERSDLINKVSVSVNEDWKGKIIRQLEHYKKKAPYYNETVSLVKECLSVEETVISRVNVLILEKICKRLSVSFDYEYFSEMDFDPTETNEAGDWALNISKALNATEYVNPPGGTSIFDRKKFIDSGIELKFLKMNDITYNQRNKTFIPDLSIIDLMMFNPNEQVTSYLNNFALL